MSTTCAVSVYNVGNFSFFLGLFFKIPIFSEKDYSIFIVMQVFFKNICD